jgi:hypothetical protein
LKYLIKVKNNEHGGKDFGGFFTGLTLLPSNEPLANCQYMAKPFSPDRGKS